MKWLKKLLGFGEFTPTPTAAPADAGAKAFESMAKTLTALEEKKSAAAQETKEVVAPVVVPEVQAVELKVEEVAVEAPKPKAPRKPRAKKEPVAPLPQTVSQNVDEWPFPKNKPAAKNVKAK